MEIDERGKKIMKIANHKAVMLNLDYIGTEHILYGLLLEGSGVAASVLKNLGKDLNQIRGEVEEKMVSAPNRILKAPVSTPRYRNVMEYAFEESAKLEADYVGTEHILLGLMREKDGWAYDILTKFGVKVYDVWLETQKLHLEKQPKDDINELEKLLDSFEVPCKGNNSLDKECLANSEIQRVIVKVYKSGMTKPLCKYFKNERCEANKIGYFGDCKYRDLE